MTSGQTVRTINAANLHLPTVTAEAWTAIAEANDPPEWFARGGAFTELQCIQDDNGYKRLIAEAVNDRRLRHLLARLSYWYRKDRNGNDQPALPPRHVVEDMLARRDPPLPRLRGVLEAPVFLPDGRLLASDGYDANSDYYLRLDGLANIRADMPLSDARTLLVEELLGDFPFVDEASRAHVVGSLLEPFVRPFIGGPTPLRLFEAPAQGTGKGLLADLVSIVATGHTAQVMSLPRRAEEELEKRITAMLLNGHRLILLDNVKELDSNQLEAVLTSEVWRGRLLGVSKMLSLPNAALWLATGNNPRLSREMLRRTVSSRIDAGLEHPEDRDTWTHPLPGWAIRQRRQLVAACLSIAREWIEAGQPRPSAPTLGRFESWSEVIGGLLEVAGIGGFLGDRDRLRARSDPDTAEWTAFCAAWWQAFTGDAKTAGELLDLAINDDLLVDLRAGKSRLSAQQRLGHALAVRRDQVFGIHIIRFAGASGTTRNATYRLDVRAAHGGTP